jgi:Uma2 family endonuclease
MAIENLPALLDYADYLKLPDEPRGEVVEGVFTMVPGPNFNHQTIQHKLAHLIQLYLDDRPEVGVVCPAPMDVVLRRERPALILQPDLLFITAARMAIVENHVMGAPDLVVEIISPSSVRMDSVRKREFYARFGIQEFWLVWPVEERIDVFRLADGGYGEAETFEPSGVPLTTPLLPGFELPVAKVFTRPGKPSQP